MATTTFKPTINIKSSFTTIGAGFTRANKSVGSMRTILLKKTKIKRDAIAGRKSLFGKRIENQRRNDEEAVVEASKPSAIGRIGNAVLNSGKGLFDRIVDFAGTLLVGWLVNNLPTIMTMAQDLMGRIQKTVNILGNFMRDIGGIFTGSTKVFGAVLTNITNLDFFDSNKRLSTALGELESVFDDMNKQFDDGLKTLTTPLGQMPGEAPVPPTGTDYTMPPEQVGRGGGGGTVSPQAVYAYLKQLGVSDIHALGILANIEGESGFTVGSQEKSGGGGIGLFQYTYPSRKAAFLKAVPDYKTNWKGQIDFAIKSDPNTPLYLGKQFSSPEEAADDFMRNWENPNKSVYAGRRRKHNAFIKSFKSGKLQSAQISQSTPLTPVTPVITGRYGESRKGNRSHGGTDLAAPSGTPLTAVSDGEIVDSDFEKGWGNFLVMKDNLGIYHLYGHMQSGYKRRGPVKRGEVIGKVGTTGRTTGPHLHWEAGTGWNGGTITGKFDPLNKYSKSAPFSGTSGQGASPQVASISSGAPSLPSTARAPQVMVMDDRPTPQPQQPQVASGGGSSLPMIDSENVLNNLMKNYLLLDLAYT
jgi:murein DD-endopeptidase MepM/ murein hydrolase activator NlpD